MLRALGVGFMVLVVAWLTILPAMAVGDTERSPGPALGIAKARSGTAAGRSRAAVSRSSGAKSHVMALQRSTGRFARPGLIAGSCDLEPDAVISPRSGGPPGFVSLSYCLLLRRAPDAEGLDYWSEQIAGGLSPVGMVERLIESPEYRARGIRSFRRSLRALTLAPGRTDERAIQAAETRRKQLQQAIERDIDRAPAAEEAAGLRVRSEISGPRFERWVADRGLIETDRVTPALVHGRRRSGGQQINVAFVHLSATRGVSVSPGDRRSRVGTWASEIGAHVAINGNWYGPWDGPAVSDGAVYGGDDHFYTALFGFTADGDAVIEHHRAVNDRVDQRVVQGVSGHPTLIHRGVQTTDFGGDPAFTRRNPRTVIGLDETGDILILVTVDGRRSTAAGMTGAETVALMAGLGAHDAVMLDGGGSTTMWVAGKGIVNQPSGSPRSVGNQLAAYGN